MTDKTPSQEANAAHPLADKPGVTEADKAATAEILGFRDWDEATDYRNSGEMDRKVAATLSIVARHRAQSEARQSPYGGREFTDAIEMARSLIQEAKGVDGPKGGFVTDHLDDAENWLDRAIEAYPAVKLIEVERDQDGRPMICTGCGTVETLASIKGRTPGAIACCPERRMVRATAADDVARTNTDVLVEALREAIELLDELNERSTSRKFYGINQTLHSKLATVRATLARKALSVYREG